MSALADHAAQPASAYGAFESSVHAEPGGDVHLWWRRIDDLPTQGNQDNCRQTIDDDAASYRRLGYNVELVWSDDLNDADLYVRHRKPNPNSSDIALLKGMAASTWLRAGWGGSG